MSTIESITPARLSPVIGRTIHVSWTSTRAGRVNGNGRARFVLGIEIDGADRANIEAWIETAGERQAVLERQSLKALACVEGQLLHIDVMGNNGDGRIAAVTMFADALDRPGERPLFAQTSLLAKAGFAAGGYDAPIVV